LEAAAVRGQRPSPACDERSVDRTWSGRRSAFVRATELDAEGRRSGRPRRGFGPSEGTVATPPSSIQAGQTLQSSRSEQRTRGWVRYPGPKWISATARSAIAGLVSLGEPNPTSVTE